MNVREQGQWRRRVREGVLNCLEHDRWHFLVLVGLWEVTYPNGYYAASVEQTVLDILMLA